jgi:DNA-binding transcriptional LysR family regulator
VAQAVGDFRTSFPSVGVELLIGDQRLDIARGEADVALRVGAKPTDPCLVARQLGVAGWAVYCSRGYAERHGVPSSVDELEGHSLVSMDMAPADWLLFAPVPQAKVVCRSNSIPNLTAMVKAGLGIGGLPFIVGELESELKRCFAIPTLAPPVWLVYHERHRNEPHVRAFLDFLTSHVLAKRSLLAGF